MRLGVEAVLVGGALVPGDLELVEGRIARIVGGSGGSGIALPGLVDLQVNGFAGVDLYDADARDYQRVGDALLETGVTSYLPTFITADAERTIAALAQLETVVDVPGPRILGAHVEGPFLSPRRLGVHPAAHRRDPDLDLLGRLLAAGPVRVMTIAPELPGALELVDALVARAVVVSLGHTDATAEQAHAAFDRGARTVTHLFNAMRPLGHRDPGVVGAALARQDVVVQLIADGVHVAPDVERVALTAARGRLALVTDAMAGAGLGDGDYVLGDVRVEVRDGVARTADGALAGSVVTLLEAVRELCAVGATLAEAATAASAVPARILGAPWLGTLEPGAPADVLVVDDGLELVRVLVGGEERVAR